MLTCRHTVAIRDDLIYALVLHGESGSGKSALIARLSRSSRTSLAGGVILRFIGASPESGSGHAPLTSLCRQMAPDVETPVDFSKLAQVFQERLAAAGWLTLLGRTRVGLGT